MDEAKGIPKETVSEPYSAADRPFDFVAEGKQTALVCENDSAIRSKIVETLKDDGYYITVADSARDALKYMRFHVYQVIVVNEAYETVSADTNLIILYLNQLSISVRRNIFVVLLSGRFRTMDHMAAFNKSANLIINSKNIDQFGAILKRGIAENEEFYHVFKESQKKLGRI